MPNANGGIAAALHGLADSGAGASSLLPITSVTRSAAGVTHESADRGATATSADAVGQASRRYECKYLIGSTAPIIAVQVFSTGSTPA